MAMMSFRVMIVVKQSQPPLTRSDERQTVSHGFGIVSAALDSPNRHLENVAPFVRPLSAQDQRGLGHRSTSLHGIICHVLIFSNRSIRNPSRRPGSHRPIINHFSTTSASDLSDDASARDSPHPADTLDAYAPKPRDAIPSLAPRISLA